MMSRMRFQSTICFHCNNNIDTNYKDWTKSLRNETKIKKASMFTIKTVNLLKKNNYLAERILKTNEKKIP